MLVKTGFNSAGNPVMDKDPSRFPFSLGQRQGHGFIANIASLKLQGEVGAGYPHSAFYFLGNGV